MAVGGDDKGRIGEQVRLQLTQESEPLLVVHGCRGDCKQRGYGSERARTSMPRPSGNKHYRQACQCSVENYQHHARNPWSVSKKWIATAPRMIVLGPVPNAGWNSDPR